ncbi:MAG: radical SAM protein [Candidatus Levybacteria bacterium]|nr:radical SAM protein [Candidatus Levybacteria bacterium]
MIRFKRILLINPPKTHQGGYITSPLGILYLASYLRQFKQIKVDVINGTIEGESAVREKLKTFRPNLVGISSLTPGRHEALKVATIAKKVNSKCKTVLGGIHPSLMWKQIMENYPQVDYIVRGEGELTLTDLVMGKKLSSIKGLVWRKINNQIVPNPEQEFIKDLDSIPFPAWDLINPLIYPPRGEGIYNGIDLAKQPRFSIIFSRGCMACCTFCSSWIVWKGYRYRTGKNVADEIEMLVKNYNAKHFAFYDDTLTGNRKEVITFCKEIIKRKLKLAFHGTTRVDRVDEKLLCWMKKAGFYEISYGIESGSPAMLLKINKKIDLDKIFLAAKLTKKVKIRFCALMMYGLPRETQQDRLLSEKLLKKLKPDVIGTVGSIWIFPGTPLYIQAKHAKLIKDSFWLGRKPYYIYRGGLGGDPINWKLRIKDEITLSLANTFFEKPLNTFNARLERLMKKLKSAITNNN